MRRINLMPHDFLTKTSSPKKRYARGMFAVLILFAIFLFWQNAVIVRYKIPIAIQKKEIKALESGQAERMIFYENITGQREDINNQRKQILQRLAILRESEKKQVVWSDILLRLSDLVPEDIKLTKILLNEKTIIIGGLSSENINISNFMSELDRSKYFKETGFNYIRKSKDSDNPIIEFEIVTCLNPNKFNEIN